MKLYVFNSFPLEIVRKIKDSIPELEIDQSDKVIDGEIYNNAKLFYDVDEDIKTVVDKLKILSFVVEDNTYTTTVTKIVKNMVSSELVTCSECGATKEHIKYNEDKVKMKVTETFKDRIILRHVG